MSVILCDIGSLTKLTFFMIRLYAFFFFFLDYIYKQNSLKWLLAVSRE